MHCIPRKVIRVGARPALMVGCRETLVSNLILASAAYKPSYGVDKPCNYLLIISNSDVSRHLVLLLLYRGYESHCNTMNAMPCSLIVYISNAFHQESQKLRALLNQSGPTFLEKNLSSSPVTLDRGCRRRQCSRHACCHSL